MFKAVDLATSTTSSHYIDIKAVELATSVTISHYIYIDV
jgi:hypothetical protein